MVAVGRFIVGKARVAVDARQRPVRPRFDAGVDFFNGRRKRLGQRQARLAHAF